MSPAAAILTLARFMRRRGRVPGARMPNADLDTMLVTLKKAAGALRDAAGIRPERPPEAWLYKAWDDNDVMIDLIFEPVGLPITDETFERAEEIEVEAVRMQVMSLEDVLVTKLLALDEQTLDYRSLLQIARPVREQV